MVVLVCDLDHTLVHTTNFLPSDDELASLRDEKEEEGVVYRVDISPVRPSIYWVRIRPGAREFLQSCLDLGLQLGCYTNGISEYARAVVACLDPDGRFFGDRVISRLRVDSSEQKSLSEFSRRFGVEKESCLVLDDRLDVWEEESDAIMRVKAFFWFHAGVKKTGHFVGEGRDNYPREVEEQMEFHDRDVNMMAIMAKVVREVITRAKLLPSIGHAVNERRKKVFPGMVFAFSGVFMQGIDCRQQLVWIEAERAGAKCTDRITPEVTHLIVEGNRRTSKYNQAKKAGKKLVRLVWLFESLNHWKALPEDDFMPTFTKDGEELSPVAGPQSFFPSSSSIVTLSTKTKPVIDSAPPKKEVTKTPSMPSSVASASAILNSVLANEASASSLKQIGHLEEFSETNKNNKASQKRHKRPKLQAQPNSTCSLTGLTYRVERSASLHNSAVEDKRRREQRARLRRIADK